MKIAISYVTDDGARKLDGRVLEVFLSFANYGSKLRQRYAYICDPKSQLTFAVLKLCEYRTKRRDE